MNDVFAVLAADHERILALSGRLTARPGAVAVPSIALAGRVACPGLPRDWPGACRGVTQGKILVASRSFVRRSL
jgi:hypothetical protein